MVLDPSNPLRHRTAALMSFLQLHWFIRLRWIIVLTGLSLLSLKYLSRPADTSIRHTNIPPLLVILAAVIVVNLLWMVWARYWVHQTDSTEIQEPPILRHYLHFANAQVAADLLLLTVTIRFTGGVESPLTIFYLFHMVIGSLLLPARHIVLQACWLVALFALMALGEMRGSLTPHYHLLEVAAADQWFYNWRYVAAAIFTVAAAAFGILYFTLHIAQRLDLQENRLRQINQELRQSEEAIRELQRRRSRFMQVAAHQLKSPLTVIETLATLIRDQLVTGLEAQDTSRKIIRRCREGVQQVSELLTLARVQEADPRRALSEPAPLLDVLRHVVERHLPTAQQKQLQIQCDLPEMDEVFVSTHRTDLADCLGNLLDNAIKYSMGPGVIQIGIADHPPVTDLPLLKSMPSMNYSPESASVWLSIQDPGIGISPRDTRSLFEVFHRGERALAEGITGTGLGLSIVREVVDHCGGLIQVYSEIGRGSLFSIALQRYTSSANDPHT
ncbi:MAG: Adaptive-response sensory-kinase SasA [Phycisphaerae bacterium]|nr:Adaptive-response sensory-kinase SasA [Phycisphaerae bacterium]